MNQLQETAIIQLRAAHQGYAKISQMLGLSENTVKSYCQRNNLGGKRGLRSGSESPETTFCPVCGKPLINTIGHKKKRFCSDACRNHWWKEHSELIHRKAIYHITCEHCGKEFESYGNQHRKYCSRACYISHRFGNDITAISEARTPSSSSAASYQSSDNQICWQNDTNRSRNIG